MWRRSIFVCWMLINTYLSSVERLVWKMMIKNISIGSRFIQMSTDYSKRSVSYIIMFECDFAFFKAIVLLLQFPIWYRVLYMLFFQKPVIRLPEFIRFIQIVCQLKKYIFYIESGIAYEVTTGKWQTHWMSQSAEFQNPIKDIDPK